MLQYDNYLMHPIHLLHLLLKCLKLRLMLRMCLHCLCRLVDLCWNCCLRLIRRLIGLLGFGRDLFLSLCRILEIERNLRYLYNFGCLEYLRNQRTASLKHTFILTIIPNYQYKYLAATSLTLQILLLVDWNF